MEGGQTKCSCECIPTNQQFNQQATVCRINNRDRQWSLQDDERKPIRSA